MRSGAVRGLASVACAVALASCGSSGPAPASRPRPPAPIDLSVLVSDSRVSVSPSRVGAGPVVFVITNQSSSAQALSVLDSGGVAVAATAPINPDGTTRLSADFGPGDYTIATAAHSRTEAQRSIPPRIRPAQLRIGRERPSAGGRLLQP